MIYFFDYHMLT